MCIYSNNKCMCVFLISPVPIAEPLTSELIDTPVFHNLAPRPIKYRVSVPIPNLTSSTSLSKSGPYMLQQHNPQISWPEGQLTRWGAQCFNMCHSVNSSTTVRSSITFILLSFRKGLHNRYLLNKNEGEIIFLKCFYKLLLLF